MSQNLISLSLSPADLAAIDGALTTLEQTLAGLISLSPEERRTLNKMGDKSEAFCRQTLTLLAQNTGLIPPNFNLAEAQGDLANIDTLRPRVMRLRQLMEKADDSETALGSDVMSAALEGYAAESFLQRPRPGCAEARHFRTLFPPRGQAGDGCESDGLNLLNRVAPRCARREGFPGAAPALCWVIEPCGWLTIAPLSLTY